MPNAYSRRIVRVAISEVLMEQLFTQGWTTQGRVLTCTQGLPEGAKFVGSTFSLDNLASYLFFEHESFGEVLEGHPVPERRIEFKTTYLGETQ